MNRNQDKKIKSERRHNRVRAKINGTAQRPRLSVFRSNRGLFLQLIDDLNNVTLASASLKEIKKIANKVDSAKELGKLIAQKAQEKKINEVVFDRSSYKYHGRVKAVAEGAREGGLKF